MKMNKTNLALTSLLVAACSSPEPEEMLCIALGGRVATPDGPVNIESLSVGSHVLSMDPHTGERVSSRVTRIVSAQRECVSIRFGDTTLRCTPTHPLYDPAQEEYVPASEWIEGRREQLMDSEHRRVLVEEVELDGGVHQVFDITVEHPLHNFLVDGVLVHNKSVEPFTTGEMSTSAETDETTGGATDTESTTGTTETSAGAGSGTTATSEGSSSDSGSGSSSGSGAGSGSTGLSSSSGDTSTG